ncbi:MAG: ferrous iron transport protein B [Pseudomonadota bacterium]|nr:ferrous iron transport protein B [Pseudomonadota bacterium]
MSAAPARAAALPRVALAGNPNTGKTSLFNRLTGANARVGNYPGVTVEREIGRWSIDIGPVEVMDVPGAYSLAARSSEEQVAMRALFGLDGDVRPSAVILVVDATQLVRNLYFALQLIEAGVPLVIALNLMDVARSQGNPPDPVRVSDALGVPVVAVSANTGEGLAALGVAVSKVLARPDEGRARVTWRYPSAAERDVTRLVPLVTSADPTGAPPAEARALAIWALLSVEPGDELLDIPANVRREVATVRAAADAAGRDLDTEIIGARYRYLDGLGLARPPSTRITLTDRVDAWVLHPVFGLVSFLFVMGVLFQSLFAWSDPFIGAIEAAFAWLGDGTRAVLPPGILADFLVDGIINGFGSVLVFLPQILMLFAMLGFLEDSGYMARVAYLVDRGMKAVGLHGKAFVPMLSGYACAVPAIMATRTLERRRDRLLTMMVVPLMSCSARLPIYTLIIASLFPVDGRFLWIFPVQGSMMVFMYVFSTLMALLAAGVLGKTLLRGPKVPLLLELPPYRLPRASSVLRQMWLRAKMFVTEAGTVILGCTIALWFLLAFPRNVVFDKDYDSLRAGASDEVVEMLDAEQSAERLQKSYGGRLGKLIEPAIAPLGFDWKIGIGLVGAFAAREVFVSTMGVVYGIGADTDEESTPLRDRIRAEKHPDGSPIYTPLMGLSLMIFFALSAQCMSTLAVVKRESRSWRWPIFLFSYMTVLAWVVSFAVYQGGRALGFE